MEKTNITLALPKELMQKVKMLAVKRHTSVSRLMVDALEELVQQERAYEHARRRQLAWMETGFRMGTQGKRAWTREDLHER